MKYPSFALNLVMACFLVFAVIKWQQMERQAIHYECASYSENNEFVWKSKVEKTAASVAANAIPTKSRGIVLEEDAPYPKRKPTP